MDFTLHKKKGVDLYNLIDNNEAEALQIIETKLNYDVVGYIKQYPHVITTPGIGANQTTHGSRLDSMN